MENALVYIVFALQAAFFVDPPPQEEPVSVIHFFNEKTLTYDIYCENNGPDTYSIELDFEYLIGLRPSMPYPLRKTLPPGRNLVMRLTQHNLESKGSFKIQLTYRKGQLRYDIEQEYPYLFPLSPRQEVRPVCRDSLEPFYRFLKDTSFYMAGFRTHSQDTIFASRRGVVSTIKNHLDHPPENNRFVANYLDVAHSDGTYARYEGIKKNSAMIAPGQLVEAGDPIALTRPRSDSLCPLFTFRVFYYDDLVVTRKIGPENTTQTNLPILFHDSIPIDSLSCENTYYVRHPKAIICREMTRRAIKRWMKRKNLSNSGKKRPSNG